MHIVMLQRRQGGVGLIEILVAVFILAVGFLAAARMQVSAMQFSQSAYFESQAYFMAGDMLARMRANVAGVKDGNYDNISTTSVTADPQCGSKFCSTAQIAQQDLYDWSRYMVSDTNVNGFTPLLPSSSTLVAKGTVTRLANGQHSVVLEWADENNEDTAGVGNLRLDFIAEQ